MRREPWKGHPPDEVSKASVRAEPISLLLFDVLPGTPYATVRLLGWEGRGPAALVGLLFFAPFVTIWRIVREPS